MIAIHPDPACRWEALRRPTFVAGRKTSLQNAEEAGFTLIELMVVLLILAILLAIAIPTFLGVSKSANDRAAQSNLNTSLVNAKSTFQVNGQSYALGVTSASYSSSLATTMASGNPALSYVVGSVSSTSSPATVSVSVATDGNAIVLAEQARGTGNCWYVIDNDAAESTTSNGAWSTTGFPVAVGTYFGEAKNTGTAPTCSAASPVAVPTPDSPPTVLYQSTSFPNL
jgi:type IV pilus assembly protein PilA